MDPAILHLHVLRLANGCQIVIYATGAASADKPVHDTGVVGYQQLAIGSEVGFQVMGDVAAAAPLKSRTIGAQSGDAVRQLPDVAVDGTLVLQHVKLEESVAVVRSVLASRCCRAVEQPLQPPCRLLIHRHVLQHSS